MWILFVWGAFSTSSSMFMINQEFETKEACVFAYEVIRKRNQYKDGTSPIEGVCVPKK